MNLLLIFGIAVVTACSGCDGGGGSPSNAATSPPVATAAPEAASVSRDLEVSGSLRQAPFDVVRKLTVPRGFGIRLYARVSDARFMAMTPSGDLLVSNPGAGTITLLRPRPNDIPQQFEFAGGLTRPHDMVFHRVGSLVYLYVAESNRVTRSVYTHGDTRTQERQTVVGNLPDSSLPELGGTYFHELKNIAISQDNKLYVSIASSCNVCEEDVTSNPVRGAIYEYSADGAQARVYARGLRNAEGLDFLPGTNRLWVTVNSRDQIPYPLDNDFDGDGVSDAGKIIPRYVDDNPPDLFTQVRDGGNYGWPYCHFLPNASMSNLEPVRDYDVNKTLLKLDCSRIDRIAKGMRAHSAPLGLSFLQASNVPVAYRKGAAIASHGCWNCTTLNAGYKISFFPFDDAGNAGAEMDLVTGFVTDPQERSVWGRPVDVIPDGMGSLLISDDHAGAIYQLYPTQ
ncbi:MAG: sugar dehydrogenase [Burkholderiales bacterium]|nr:sugar dehydrogenase [Burkholderiales bacterium]